MEIGWKGRQGPPLVDLSLELPRTWAAFAQFTAVSPLLTRVPKGDGHPVLVMPGFLASDLSTLPLRRLLGRLGYDAHGWALGRNVGPTKAVVDGLTRAVQEVGQRSDTGTVSLVGWSLGGVYGRELARRFPERVRQVITLGSPFNTMNLGFGATADPLPVPSTALYTRSDGIVDWQTTVQRSDERSENVEVRGSHCGLGVNPAAVLAMADRLAQPAGEWAPFRPPAALRRWYPRPWSVEDDGEVAVDGDNHGDERDDTVGPAWTA
jgi:pimeloyl-ACP methyl ester carboxylesterase